MTYELMREIAGSWMLLFMFLFFSGVILWVFRPGAGPAYRDSAHMIFRHDDGPLGDTSPRDDADQPETRI